MGVILGIYWDNGKENGNYREYRGYRRVNIGIMRNKMETTVFYGFKTFMEFMLKDLGFTGAYEQSFLALSTRSDIAFTRGI